MMSVNTLDESIYTYCFTRTLFTIRSNEVNKIHYLLQICLMLAQENVSLFKYKPAKCFSCCVVRRIN